MDDKVTITNQSTVTTTVTQENTKEVRSIIFLLFAEFLGYESPLISWAEQICKGKTTTEFIEKILKMEAYTIFTAMKKEYTIEVDSKNEIIELTCEYFDKEELGTPIIKWAIINEQKIELSYGENYLYIISPKSIASMKDEKYLYINKMIKYNGCERKNVICQADQFKDYWHCSCGTVNLNSQSN